jgi:hypothetical protein
MILRFEYNGIEYSDFASMVNDYFKNNGFYPAKSKGSELKSKNGVSYWLTKY